MPRVSIIVPNYNHAQFLDLRLQSILDQTFDDFELIFLDDASTDGSLQVFNEYRSDGRVRSILNDENSGSPFIQWNRGIDEACGEYIWIAESDDYCERDFLARLVAAMDKHPEAGLAYSQSWIVSQDDEKLKVLDWYHVFGGGAHWATDFASEGKQELKQYMAIQNTIPNASAVLIRRSVLEGDLRAPEHMKLCGDWLFWTRILLKSDLAFIATPLNCFRQAHANSQRSASAKAGLEALESLEIQQEILRFVQPERVFVRRMFNHHLKRWASLAFHDQLPRSFDFEVADGFRRVYELGRISALSMRIQFWTYFHFVLPAMRSFLYRSTVGRFRLYYRRKMGAA